MTTAYGNLYVTVNEDSQGPFEVFAQMGKAGGFFSAQTEAITRLISLALRSNVAIEEIIAQIKRHSRARCFFLGRRGNLWFA